MLTLDPTFQRFDGSFVEMLLLLQVSVQLWEHAPLATACAGLRPEIWEKAFELSFGLPVKTTCGLS